MNTARDRLRGLARTYLRRRYTILFYTLLLTLVAAPIISALKMSGALLESLLAASLLLLTMVVVWLARPLTGWLDRPDLAVMTLGIWTLIGLLAAAAALRFAMRAGQVDAERLYSALSAYLLRAFTLVYCIGSSNS